MQLEKLAGSTADVEHLDVCAKHRIHRIRHSVGKWAWMAQCPWFAYLPFESLRRANSAVVALVGRPHRELLVRVVLQSTLL